MSADLTQTNGTGIPASGLNKFVVLTNDSVLLTGAVATDAIAVINVPAGFLCFGGCVKIVTACDVASSAASLGDSDNVDGYVDAVALDGAAGTATKTTGAADEDYGIEGGSSGRLYTAADTIDLYITTMGSTATAGEVSVYVWGIQVW